MSKHDFTEAEFSARAARAREAIGAAGLDHLLVIHPVSMRWLIGQDTKSYTLFQCLLVSAKPGPLVLFTRGTDRAELEADDNLSLDGVKELLPSFRNQLPASIKLDILIDRWTPDLDFDGPESAFSIAGCLRYEFFN